MVFFNNRHCNPNCGYKKRQGHVGLCNEKFSSALLGDKKNRRSNFEARVAFTRVFFSVSACISVAKHKKWSRRDVEAERNQLESKWKRQPRFSVSSSAFGTNWRLVSFTVMVLLFSPVCTSMTYLNISVVVSDGKIGFIFQPLAGGRSTTDVAVEIAF